MNKGFIHIGNLVFSVVIFVGFLFAGYLFFFSNSNNITSRVGMVKTEQVSKLKFVHPTYQYSLELPYSWNDKYQVSEDTDTTNFWYLNESGNYELLFVIKRQLISEPIILSGKNKTLGQSDGFLYVLNIPNWSLKDKTEISKQVREEALLVGDTFSLPIKKEYETEITKILASSSLADFTSKIKFSAFEIIATQENASTTEYYIWFTSREFAWDNFHLRDWPIMNSPAVVVVPKDINKLVSIEVPLKGKNFNFEVKKIFPKSVSESDIFRETTVEHSVMLSRISNRLAEMVQNYFGSEPVLTRVGFIKEISETPGVFDLKVYLAESSDLVHGSFSVSKIDKVVSQLFVSSSTDSLFLPVVTEKNTLGIISTTTSQVLPTSQWSTIFNKNSTSTWAKKPFWFETKNDVLLKIYPF